MDSLVCSLCKEVMSRDNAKEFGIEVPQIGKTLTFKACVACQERAKTNTLHICLSCRSISWYPSGVFCSNGLKYSVKSHCNSCMTKAITEIFAESSAQL